MKEMTPKNYCFAALVSPSREVRILCSASLTLRQLYRKQMLGENPDTAHFFDTGRAQLFALETVETTAPKAFGRCMMWALHFADSGYSVSDWGEVEPYVRNPYPGDLVALKEIKEYKIDEICSPELDLAADFTFKEVPHTIKLVVTPEELRRLKKAAVDRGLSLQAYCKRRFDRGFVKSVDLAELHSCEQQCRAVVMRLERAGRLAQLTGEGGPAVDKLLSATGELRQEVRALTRQISRYMEVTR